MIYVRERERERNKCIKVDRQREWKSVRPGKNNPVYTR